MQVALSWKTTQNESLLKRESPNLTKCELHGCKYFPAEGHRSCCRRARLSWQPTNELRHLVLNTSLVCHPEFKFSTDSVSRDCAVEVSSTSVTGVTCERSMSANPCRSTTQESPMRSISGCTSTTTVTRVVKQHVSKKKTVLKHFFVSYFLVLAGWRKNASEFLTGPVQKITAQQLKKSNGDCHAS